MHTGELPHNNFAVVFAQSHASWFKMLSFNHLWNQGECTEIDHAKKRHAPFRGCIQQGEHVYSKQNVALN